MSHASHSRNARLEAEIRAVLAELLQHHVKDPRLDGVVVSVVRLAAERTNATVYFSVVGDDERERRAADGFAAAAPFLRRELGGRMRLRTVPNLSFKRDQSFEYGDRIERLFDRLHRDGVLEPPEPAAGDE